MEAGGAAALVAAGAAGIVEALTQPGGIADEAEPGIVERGEIGARPALR